MALDRSTTGMTEFKFGEASSHIYTLEEAVKILKNNAQIRTVKETLSRYCGVDLSNEADLKKRVIDILLKCDPDSKRDSVERKVRSWMKDDAQYIGKKSAIHLAFGLHLPVDRADQLLIRLTGERFHWRDPEDIIWVFGLLNRLSFAQTSALLRRMTQKIKQGEDESDQKEALTGLFKGKVINLHTEQQLEAFLIENRQQLGTMHNTAYGLFIQFLNLLGMPSTNDFLPVPQEMSVTDIVSTYMYKNFVPKARGTVKMQKDLEDSMQSAIQRDIRQNWPDEVVLSRMTHRECDVTRKVLILLFLACDGGESEYGDFSDDTLEDTFLDIYGRISNMLNDCGFAPLDARAPFDWMVLYCMCVDENIFIDDNVQRFLKGVFSTDGYIPDDED